MNIKRKIFFLQILLFLGSFYSAGYAYDDETLNLQEDTEIEDFENRAQEESNGEVNIESIFQQSARWLSNNKLKTTIVALSLLGSGGYLLLRNSNGSHGDEGSFNRRSDVDNSRDLDNKNSDKVVDNTIKIADFAAGYKDLQDDSGYLTIKKRFFRSFLYKK